MEFSPKGEFLIIHNEDPSYTKLIRVDEFIPTVVKWKSMLLEYLGAPNRNQLGSHWTWLENAQSGNEVLIVSHLNEQTHHWIEWNINKLAQIDRFIAFKNMIYLKSRVVDIKFLDTINGTYALMVTGCSIWGSISTQSIHTVVLGRLNKVKEIIEHGNKWRLSAQIRDVRASQSKFLILIETDRANKEDDIFRPRDRCYQFNSTFPDTKTRVIALDPENIYTRVLTIKAGPLILPKPRKYTRSENYRELSFAARKFWSCNNHLVAVYTDKSEIRFALIYHPDVVMVSKIVTPALHGIHFFDNELSGILLHEKNQLSIKMHVMYKGSELQKVSSNRRPFVNATVNIPHLSQKSGDKRRHCQLVECDPCSVMDQNYFKTMTKDDAVNMNVFDAKNQECE